MKHFIKIALYGLLGSCLGAAGVVASEMPWAFGIIMCVVVAIDFTSGLIAYDAAVEIENG
jgi:uncharacterized protein (DUF2062 family)